MDIAALAVAVTAFLAPLLPYLLKGGEEAVKEVGKKFGAGIWDKGAELLKKLHGAEEVERAAKEVANAPEDPDAEGALRLQLRKLLKADPALAVEVSRLLEEARQGGSYHAVVHGDGAVAQGPGAVAAGKGGIAVGGSVQGGMSIIRTGGDTRSDD